MNARTVRRVRAAAILLAVVLAYVLVPQVSHPTPAAAMRVHQSTAALCGTVSSYTAPSTSTTGSAGSITLNGSTYAIAPGAAVAGSISVGQSVCLNGIAFASGGAIQSATAASYTPTQQTICGTVTNFSAPNPSQLSLTNGQITIGGTTYTIAANGTFSGNVTVANNQNQCFVLTLNGSGQRTIVTGQVTSNTSGSSTVCGAVTGFTAAQASAPGTIIINGVQYTITTGVAVSNSSILPPPGSTTPVNACLQITQNGAGQITAATASSYTATNQTICGTVSNYTPAVAATGTTVGSNGAITINGAQYTIAAGSTFTGSAISNGANICVVATLNGTNQLTGGQVSANTSSSQTICGLVSSYVPATSTATGSITIGSTPFTIATGTTLSPATGVTIQNGANLCFALTQSATGQITSATVTAFSPNSTVCGVVGAYTPATSSSNGSVTIGGQQYVITLGTSFSGTAVTVGSNLCFQLTLNSANQITGAVVTSNTPTVAVVCGVVASYTAPTSSTAGSLIIGTTTYTLAVGALPVGTTITVGQSLCFNFTLNGAGQATAVTVTPNTPSTLTVCGPVTAYTAATATTNGSITINGTPYTIAAGSVLTTPSGVTVQNGVTLCFQLSLNGAGQITAANVAAATTPTPTSTATATPTNTVIVPTSTPTATSTAVVPTPTSPAATNTPLPAATKTAAVSPGQTGPPPAAPTAVPIPAGVPHTGAGGLAPKSNAAPRGAAIATTSHSSSLGISSEPRTGGADGSPGLPLLPLFGAMLTGVGVLVRRLSVKDR